MTTTEITWLIVGFSGQAFFSARFIIQYIKSEQLKKSVIPTEFWYLSIVGGVLLFIYAWYRMDPVFILGQGAGLLIYARNLQFIHREKKESRTVD